MSFRTAYSSFKNSRSPQRPQGLIRDPSTEEWAKVMDAYYKQQMRSGGLGTQSKK